MLLNRSEISKTFKSQYTEEFLDILFYRPLGYWCASGSKAAGLTPNAVTVISIFFGIAAGHLFYYRDFTINLIGALVLIAAEILDSADGQLARMTGKGSRLGRILDGFSENLWFISIYMHLFVRLLRDGYSAEVILFILAAGISHSCQSAIADYYRNFFTFIVQGRGKSEIDNSEALQTEYASLSWKHDLMRKLFARLYLNYTKEQEFLSGNAVKLLRVCEQFARSILPEDFSLRFKREATPLIKYYNILTSNTRIFVLFFAVLTNNIMFYLLFEITILNLLLLYVVFRHEAICSELLRGLEASMKGTVHV